MSTFSMKIMHQQCSAMLDKKIKGNVDHITRPKHCRWMDGAVLGPKLRENDGYFLVERSTGTLCSTED